MELRHLRYFVAVAEELNFRRAADRLRVAHPSLSKQIRDLEYELQVQLLDRDTTGVSLTDAGAVFLDATRDLLRRADGAVSSVREAAAGRRGRLVVGNVGPLSSRFLSASIVAFRTRYPDVEVSLQDVELPDQMALLNDGSLHLGFTMLPEAQLPPQYGQMLVLRSQVCAMMASAHPLARKRRIRPSDVLAETVVCIGANTRFPGHAERTTAAFEGHGFQPPRIKRVSSFESLFALVASQQGITFLPRVLCAGPAVGIAVRPMIELGDNAFFEMRAVWLRQNPSALLAHFLDVLRESRPASAV
ncbi:MAG TPA: LysR substrate-binding domain-containing protein [Opitutaceae bacterium]|nr:LysR substrate-binding domain-containing protein [Opitutaceae bacterium]